MLLGVVALSALLLPQERWFSTIREIAASALFAQNWLLAARPVDYFARHDEASIVQHFWSLSAQFQFLLLWSLPLALGALFLRRSRCSFRTATAIGLGVVFDRVELPRPVRALVGWAGLVALFSRGVALQVGTVMDDNRLSAIYRATMTPGEALRDLLDVDVRGAEAPACSIASSQPNSTSVNPAEINEIHSVKTKREQGMNDETNLLYNQISNLSSDLLEKLSGRLPAEWTESYRSLSFAGEWPSLLEAICADLISDRIPISETEKDSLEELLHLLDQRDDELFPRISDIPGTLAAVHVIRPDSDAGH